MKSEDKGIANQVSPGFRQRISKETPEELVSVIIPAFNSAATIRQTLDSVVAQTYQTFEVIVVDDGSSDGTATIAEEFVRKDFRFQLIRQSNQGVGAARNAAIQRACGQYIAPLDSDDLWFPKKLEKQVAYLARRGPETGLVYCWYNLIGKDGEFVGLGDKTNFEGRSRHGLILASILSNILGNASVPVFRAAALERAGLYLTRTEQGGAQGCEDWDLALRIAELFDIGVVPEYLVAYRETSSNMSADVINMTKSYAVTMNRARRRNHLLPSAIFRWSAGYFFMWLVNKCYDSGDYSLCLRYLKEAAWANPFLLLRTEVYRKLARSSLHLADSQIARHLRKQAQPSPEKKEKKDTSSSRRERKRPFISNRIFSRIELRRWYAAFHDSAYQIPKDTGSFSRPHRNTKSN